MTTTPPQDGPPVRLVLRPLGTGLPLGYLSFAIGMLLLAANALGWVPPDQTPTSGLLVAAYVTPLELVAAVMAFLGRDTVGATTLGLFTTSWLALGLELLRAAPGATSPASGIFQVGFAAVIAGLAVVAAPGKPLFAVVLALSSARSLLEGLHQLTGSTALQAAGGVVALAVVAGAVYTGLALLVENAWPRAVLPVFRRGPAVDALGGALTAGERPLAGEPGVRQQL